MTAFKGLSLLDQRVHLTVADDVSGEPRFTPSTIGDVLPSALLPAFRGEAPITGPSALLHRRGLGLPWPPEAQSRLSKGGPGRIPLAVCWGRLFGETSSVGSLDEPFSWRPHLEDCRSRPSELLASSALQFAGHTAQDDLVVVVPDRLDDGGLQVLSESIAAEQGRRYRGSSERGRVRFLWRSAAVALSWCREHRRHFADRGSSSEEGEPLGHLPVISLGTDSFEVVVCEIVARRFEGETWLLPVIDRRYRSELLGPWGITLLAAHAAERGRRTRPDELWRRLQLGGPADLLERPMDREALLQATSRGAPKAILDLLHDHPELAEFLPLSEHDLDGTPLGRRLVHHLEERRSSLPRSSQTLLGAVFTGSPGRICFSAGRSIRDVFIAFLDRAGLPPNRVLQGDDSIAAMGAARFAWCSATGRPTYRERLLPLQFFAAGRDELGDAVPEWMPLLDVETVEGGKVHERAQPIAGMHINAGSDELTLLLRSQRHGEAVQIRAVPAALDRVTRTEQPVRLNVSVEPGQGYARVEVRSEAPGLFRCHLDWRRMQPSAEPALQLSYVSQVWRMDSEWRRWSTIRRETADLLELFHQRRPDSTLLHFLKLWGDSIAKPQRHETDLWAFVGPISSDGVVSGPGATTLLDPISEALAERYRLTDNDKLRHEIVRTAGWTFLAVHPYLVEQIAVPFARVSAVFSREARAYPDRIRGGTRWRLRDTDALDLACKAVKPAHLTAAGHCFVEEQNIRQVFEAARARFELSMEGTNNWLRALRNLVRYRQHTLAPASVSREVVDEIWRCVVTKLEEQSEEANFHHIFRNCLTILMFLLKRRRYEPEFPEPGRGPKGSGVPNGGSASSPSPSPAGGTLLPRHTRALGRLLAALVDNPRVPQRDREIARITGNFLRREGTGDDLTDFLSLTD